MVERSFRTMGTVVRVYVGARLDARLPDPETMAGIAEAQLTDFGRRLSRFRPESELSQMNRDRREQVPASALLRDAVRAGVWAAQRTGGLIDPTLVGQLEAIGYATSRDGVESAPLSEAVAEAPPRRRAMPDPRQAWRAIRVLDEAAAISRPPGLMFDTGGTGKGLAADLLARRLSAYARFAVDCGGDIRVGGRDPGAEPVEIEIRHPITGEAAETLAIASGAVATSGIDARLWRLPDGRHAHHLIDPSSGEPAWTGLICATARAPTALEADTLAKAALLSGPLGARDHLLPHGGLVVADDGCVERIAPPHDPLSDSAPATP